MKKKYMLIFFSVVLVFSTSCTKFEEGAFISLRSAEFNIMGTWKISEVLENDLVNDSLLNEEANNLLVFADSSSFTFQVLRNGNIAQNLAGTWQYNSDNQHLSFKTDADSTFQVYRIIRLTNKEMWLVDECQDQTRSGSSIEKRYQKQ
ncbi:MAG: lipocalin family protein [Bacteroidales bacterium]|nr:lipocalin family protein [Bacteroidales bacterium]HOY37979.1 lipocalin family protein [Bacteroidales bacterium]HQP04740.1 lipocalin family protein [Bacteroidales bacterium]